MKVMVEVDEKQFGLLCSQEEVEPLMKKLSELYGIIWTEAVYDPETEETHRYARRLLPLIQDVNKILEFKK